MKQIYNFIPTDIDIEVYGIDTVESIDNTCDNDVYVYLAKIKDMEMYTRCIELGDKDIFDISKKSLESVYALALLKYAVRDRWGIEEDFSTFKVSKNGKPYVEGYNFSISHSCSIVCVAISKMEVGVDIECVLNSRNWLGLRRRVLTQKEKEEVAEDSQTMTAIWTKKEAVFKLLGDKVFSPSNMDIEKYNIDTVEHISHNYNEGEDYALSIATSENTNNYLFIKRAYFNKNTWELE